MLALIMKKYNLIIIFIIVCCISCFNSCTNRNKTSRKESIVLKNGLGVIEFYLPNYFDTLKNSIYISDYPCGDKISFLFCKKDRINLFADTTYAFGPYPEIPLRNSETNFVKFLISQPLQKECGDSLNKIDSSFLLQIKNKIQQKYLNSQIIYSELIKNQKNTIAVIVCKTSDPKKNYETIELVAYTIIKYNMIEFNLYQQNYTELKLYEQIIKSLKTMKFEN